MKRFITVLSVMVISFVLSLSSTVVAVDLSVEDLLKEFESDVPVNSSSGDSNVKQAVTDDGYTIKEIYEDINAYPEDESNYKKILGVFAKNNQKGIKVFVDGNLLDFSKYNNVEPVIIEDRTLVPIRALSEAMGAEVDYDNGVITIDLGGDTIVLNVGSKHATINEKSATMDVAATIVDGRTLIPLRFVSQNFGKEVGWYPNSSVGVNVISVFEKQ